MEKINLILINSVWNQYDKHYYVKRTELNGEALIAVDNIVEKKKIYLFDFFEPYSYSEDTLDWSIDPYENKTWVLYFHSLRMVSYLLNAFEMTKELIYLKKAQWFINSWIDNNPLQGKKTSTQAWRDHSVASRIITFIYFWDYYRNSEIFDEEFSKKFIDILEEHGEFIALDENYTFRHNHGIMQSRALLELSILFPNFKNSQKWFMISKERLLDHINHDITPSGVHKEHSPTYHKLVLEFFISINELLTYYQKYDSFLDDTISKMKNYLDYIAKPDGSLPIVGDSKNGEYWYNTSQKTLTDIVYPDANIAIFRNNCTTKKPLYLAFFSGFHSRTHKHADDLSFILTYDKTDYFVDSGAYGYTENDPYRKYVRSVFAHNSFSVDGKSFSLRQEQIGKAQIETYGIRNGYSYVQAIHTLFLGVKISRTLVYLKTGSIILKDDLISENDHHYFQIFNIGKDVDISKTESKMILKSKVDSSEIELIQLNPTKTYQKYNGSKDPIMGWQSNKMYEVEPITTITFEQTAKVASFLTLINLQKDGILKADFNHDILTLTFNNNSIKTILIKP